MPRPTRMALAAALLAAACHHARAVPAPPGAAMLGRWELRLPARPPAQPTLNAGVGADIEIDSAAGDAFAGRVVSWRSGDVILRPGVFAGVRGTVGDSGVVRLAFDYANGVTPPLEMGGRLRGDTLALDDPANPAPFTAGAVWVRTRR